MSPDDETQADNIAVLIDQCKPESVDVISLVKKYNRIFLGYPLLKKYANDKVKDIGIDKIYGSIKDIVFDPSELKEDNLKQDIKECRNKYELPYEDASNRPDKDYLNYCKAAKNIVRTIHKVIDLLKSDHPHKVYALIYRPPFSYVGIIDGWDFPKGQGQEERVNMLKDYLKLCNNKANKTSHGDQNLQEQENVLKDLEACNKKTKTSTASHVAHMALTFKLRDLKLITPILPISEIMIRSQAKLSGLTAKDIELIEDKQIIKWIDVAYEKAKNREKLDLKSFYEELSSSYKNDEFPILKYLLTPTGLETLSINLLNLENKDQTWFHSGGMGDMGVDGFGIDNDGNVVGFLQCKKEFKLNEKGESSDLKNLKNDIKERLIALIDKQNEEHKEITLYIATLSDLSDSKEVLEGDLIEGIAKYKILDYKRIECLVGKHKKELGQTLRWISDVVPDNDSEDCLKPKAEVPFQLPLSQSASEPVILRKAT